MQSSDEASCSDCKLEIIQKAWTDMLFKWLHKCVHPDKEINMLTPICLSDIMNKYKTDICENDIDRAILCTDDIEPFIKYKYPILRLRNLSEISDYKKKQYIMTTVLLFHCCIKSQSGIVHADICKHMSKYEQEVILKFCERLNDMEITINNVDCAIKEAFDYVKYVRNIPKNTEQSSSDLAQASTDDSLKISYADLQLNGKLTQVSSKLPEPLKYNSSVTVLPSVVTDTSTYSDLVTESDNSEHNRFIFSDSDEVTLYPVRHKRRKIKRKCDEINAESKHRVRGYVELEIKQPTTFKNCGGTCCQREPYRNLPDKEPFYDPDKDPFEKRRESISIKEPKFKNNKKVTQEVLKESEAEDNSADNKADVDNSEEFAVTKHAVAEDVKKLCDDKDTKHQVDDSDFCTPCCGPHDQEIETKNDVLNVLKSPCETFGDHQSHDLQQPLSEARCLENCSCTKCIIGGTWCGDSNNPQKEICGNGSKEPPILNKLLQFKEIFTNMPRKKKKIIIGVAVAVIIIIILIFFLINVLRSDKAPAAKRLKDVRDDRDKFTYSRIFQEKHTWICENKICQKVHLAVTDKYNTFSSLSRCSLICMGPQLWPYPIGYTFFSNRIVALATNRLEYKFQSIPSEAVHQYLAEAFKLFIGDLARLERIDDKNEKNDTNDLTVKKLTIQIDVESDPDPRLRINTEESYNLKIETLNNKIFIKISSASFCGVRHALQTLSQMILLDQSSGKLITLSYAVIKDGPTYRYRGLMIDTARNYIPVVDLMRTIDAMATVKLNTFHWRISDVTSFPLYLPDVPELFEYGAYDRSLIYTKEDVRYLVNRASMRGIRVLIEVAAPGPVGRAWSWHPEVSCPSKTPNFTCSNVVCLRLQLHDSILDILQTIYTQILEMTKTDDVFHLSDGVFSIANCYYLIEERQGFLDKALERLKRANKGFLPKLPIIWHTYHLYKDFEAKTWEQYGVQIVDLPRDPGDFLSKFKVIHSSKWDLSCEMNKNRCIKYRTWQEMYSWKSWRNMEVFTVEGGEAILWTDLVNTGNLDSHIWPRAAAVAERLWSDTIANTSAGAPVYTRLDSQRWRMLLNGVKVQPIWPLWCSLNPSKCLEKVR